MQKTILTLSLILLAAMSAFTGVFTSHGYQLNPNLILSFPGLNFFVNFAFC